MSENEKKPMTRRETDCRLPGAEAGVARVPAISGNRDLKYRVIGGGGPLKQACSLKPACT